MASFEETLLRFTFALATLVYIIALAILAGFCIKRYREEHLERYLNVGFVYITLIMAILLFALMNLTVHPGYGNCIVDCQGMDANEYAVGFGIEFWALAVVMQFMVFAAGLMLAYALFYEQLSGHGPLNNIVILVIFPTVTILNIVNIFVVFRLTVAALSFSLLLITTLILTSAMILNRTRIIGPKYRLVSGTGYLVQEKKPLESVGIFADLIKHGASGLCISRTPPSKLKARFGMSSGTFHWLTKNKDDDSLDPSNLRKIMIAVTEFLEKTEGTRMILLEGFEYLLDFNNFNTLIRFVGDIQDEIASAKANLILPINPAALEDQDRARLERSLESLSA